MKIHFDAGNENDCSRNVGKHRKTRCHIIRLIADKAFYHNHVHFFVRPENEVVNIHTKYIEKVGDDKLPIFLKIPENRLVAIAILPKISLYQRIFQHRCEEKSNVKRGKHALRNSPVQFKAKKKRCKKCKQHTCPIVLRDSLVILTDGQIDHRVKDKHKTDICPESGKHIPHGNAAHKMLPQAKWNAKKTAQGHIKNHAKIIAWKDILIALLIDYIRHVP